MMIAINDICWEHIYNAASKPAVQPNYPPYAYLSVCLPVGDRVWSARNFMSISFEFGFSVALRGGWISRFITIHLFSIETIHCWRKKLPPRYRNIYHWSSPSWWIIWWYRYRAKEDQQDGKDSEDQEMDTMVWFSRFFGKCWSGYLEKFSVKITRVLCSGCHASCRENEYKISK